MQPQQKSKIKWRCRRGMLELDLLLEQFVDKHLDAMSEEQVLLFEDLLQSNDPDLYAWLMGNADPVDKALGEIIEYIRAQDKA